MGYYCTVPQCTSLAGKTKNVKFHRFPRDESMARKWNDILKRGKPYTIYSKVCSLHFTQADYNVTTMGQWKTLSKDAIPSQNLPKLHPDGTVMVIRKSRTVKYRDVKKEESDKTDNKWQLPMAQVHAQPLSSTPDAHMASQQHDNNVLAYRLQTLGHMASNIQHPLPHHIRPKKQDAIMQTDPVQNDDDETQPNNSYSEVSEKSYSSEVEYTNYNKETDYNMKEDDYPKDYPKETYSYPKEGYKDYPDYPKEQKKNYKDDYIPQTNEEYNKEAEKYALERKSHNAYDLKEIYQKQLQEYPKIPYYDKYPRENYYQPYDNADVLRSQQHNLAALQDRQGQLRENQGFFNENAIKQEIDMTDDDKYVYERAKEQLGENPYAERRIQHQRLLDHLQQQVKQEPEPSACDSVMQPQGSPYYPPTSHNNMPGYYDPLSRPGPELLIAKQNALAAHTQLWQNTMKRPFFYSENAHYNGTQLLHRYEDLSRILQ